MFYSIRKQYIIDEANLTNSQVQEYVTSLMNKQLTPHRKQLLFQL